MEGGHGVYSCSLRNLPLLCESAQVSLVRYSIPFFLAFVAANIFCGSLVAKSKHPHYLRKVDEAFRPLSFKAC